MRFTKLYDKRAEPWAKVGGRPRWYRAASRPDGSGDQVAEVRERSAQARAESHPELVYVWHVWAGPRTSEVTHWGYSERRDLATMACNVVLLKHGWTLPDCPVTLQDILRAELQVELNAWDSFVAGDAGPGEGGDGR